MRRVTAPHPIARPGAAELSDPALAHLFGPGTAPLAVEPAALLVPYAPPASRWLAWTQPPELVEGDETLLRLEDGGYFEIREVPREAPADLDFEISVEFGTPGVMNLDDFPAEFEADMAVFEGIGEKEKGLARVPAPLVLGGRCRA